MFPIVIKNKKCFIIKPLNPNGCLLLTPTSNVLTF